MNDQSSSGGVSYKQVGADYFEKRGLKRYAKVWSLWALGVGAVISGHYSGWNFGLANGFGSMLVALFIIAAMYWGLIFSLAEMSPALPHTGAAYSFARSAMGPWGGMFTGLAESIEYILTPAVIVFFIGSYMTAIFETPPEWQPPHRSVKRCIHRRSIWTSSRTPCVWRGAAARWWRVWTWQNSSRRTYRWPPIAVR